MGFAGDVSSHDQHIKWTPWVVYTCIWIWEERAAVDMKASVNVRDSQQSWSSVSCHQWHQVPDDFDPPDTLGSLPNMPLSISLPKLAAQSSAISLRDVHDVRSTRHSFWGRYVWDVCIMSYSTPGFKILFLPMALEHHEENAITHNCLCHFMLCMCKNTTFGVFFSPPHPSRAENNITKSKLPGWWNFHPSRFLTL